MNIIEEVDLLRIKANSQLDSKRKSSLGQFFTPAPICQFMASLFSKIEGKIELLEPGCGVGSLVAAFTEEGIRRGDLTAIDITAYDIEPIIKPFIEETFEKCSRSAAQIGASFTSKFLLEDFILANYKSSTQTLFTTEDKAFTHVITNPPYKKINNDSEHRKALSKLGIDTVNLYSGFVALAIKLLKPGGEIVAIIPRSFCNGPYYLSFRKILLEQTYIRHIHIFESRDNAFEGDDVLQENIIIHCQKNGAPGKIKITSSPKADFHIDSESLEFVATDTTIREVNIESIVNPDDPQHFIHIATTKSEQKIIDALSCFNSSLEQLELEVSTGPVVDFRMTDHLRQTQESDTVPLLYPHHFNGSINWPKETKKCDSIVVNNFTIPWLWSNKGNYVITKRFSSKEEKRRIVASIYDSSLPFKMIGFENKLNVIHKNKRGIEDVLAKGLYVYLNCTLIDKYYRHFGGHTQVNASDLRSLKYPNLISLRRIGAKVDNVNLTQSKIDSIIDEEIFLMTGNSENLPLKGKEKIEQAIQILKSLGMPRAQQNERSALTLLALANLQPAGSWDKIERPLLGVTPIMDWCRDVYEKEYAPNTRETFRRQTLHQLVAAGIVLYNPDEPERAVNSPKACYQIVPEVFDLLHTYGTSEWEENLKVYLSAQGTLAKRYAMEREMAMIALEVEPEYELKLSAGAHSQLIKEIITEFGPRFAPGAEVIYVGDTGDKAGYFKKDKLSELGIKVNDHGKMPDVVLYYTERNWLLLIESVTSHGPVDSKRHEELEELFKDSKVGLVYVTAFPNKKLMAKYLPEISWETEVWVADAPTHMIHFNGERFLGPYNMKVAQS